MEFETIALVILFVVILACWGGVWLSRQFYEKWAQVNGRGWKVGVPIWGGLIVLTALLLGTWFLLFAVGEQAEAREEMRVREAKAEFRADYWRLFPTGSGGCAEVYANPVGYGFGHDVSRRVAAQFCHIEEYVTALREEVDQLAANRPN